ncbi:MAG: hypothetical protein ABIR62_07905 [Dokdonella sp.]|uniref:hypothetical protein n=1 Tax=Dokdonella sp. TaxID=2291710 RepID=UPI003264975C
MNPTLANAFLLLLALFTLLLAANSVRTGEVAWRGGNVAARRNDNPGLFWLLVAALVGVGVLIAWRVLS